MLNNLYVKYKGLPNNVVMLFIFEFTISLIHVAFILILNIYLRKQGFDDPEIASFNSLRFIGALLFSLPLGIYIRNKKLKPFFIISSLTVSITSLIIIESIRYQMIPFIKLAFFSWGLGMMLMRVCSLPFIIRNTNSNNTSEALSLSAATWSLATIVVGIIISGLDWISVINIFNVPFFFDEKGILRLIALMSFSSLIFAQKINENVYGNKIVHNEKFSMKMSYNWGLIFRAISPLILISIGAGLTIPFVNLFFNSVFSLSSSQFSIMGSITAFLVFFSSLLVPELKRRYGYWFTIVFVQSLAIICLVIMSLTELIASFSFALYVAIFAYILRQPLMHMAHPSSNELMMNYVGKRNQELISALSSSLWSASWFISAKIFEWLRFLKFKYFEIFLITAGLYVVGVLLYVLLIIEYEQKRCDNKSKALPIVDDFSGE